VQGKFTSCGLLEAAWNAAGHREQSITTRRPMIAVQSMAHPGRSKGGLVDNGARKNSCLDRDDFRLNQSEIIAIYFNSLERDAENRCTLFRIPL
jgi:hypothetical protein